MTDNNAENNFAKGAEDCEKIEIIEAEPQSIETLRLKFPCEFPLKIIGVHSVEFDKSVQTILRKHIPEFEMLTLTSKQSSADKYRSISIVFTAESREQVDQIYIDLTADKLVKWVL